MVTAPEETAKFAVAKLATPLLEVLASSPAIVTVVPVADVSIHSPPAIVSASISKSSAVTLVST